MKILFICKYNRFRSRVAEGIFNKLSANDKFVCSSAGIELDKERPYVCDNVLEVMNSKGYNVIGDSVLVSGLNLNDYEKIVIVADNVEKENFDYFDGDIVIWNVSDCDEGDRGGVESAINEIEDEVMDFLEEINK